MISAFVGSVKPPPDLLPSKYSVEEQNQFFLFLFQEKGKTFTDFFFLPPLMEVFNYTREYDGF